MAWLSFIELDKAVVCVIRLASFLSLWFQSVCPLIPSHNIYCLNWVSLSLDVVYLFMACSSKAQLLLLTLDKGYLLTAAPPDLERGVGPLGPPVPMQPPLLGRRGILYRSARFLSLSERKESCCGISHVACTV